MFFGTVSDKARSHTSRRLAKAKREDYATRTFEPIIMQKDLQGYAARGGLVPFVPFCAIRTYLLLATQIPQSGMRTSHSLCEWEFVPFGYDIKEETPHEVVLKLCANRIQGYAARGGLVPFVPFCAFRAFLLLATQIPQSGMRTSHSHSEWEFVPLGTK